jgi:hypothetical protein
VCQIWIDHTGHNAERQYGTSTKAWQFDTVGIMTPMRVEDRLPDEVAFTLCFDQPGKARRRSPENWDDFSPSIIRLRGDRWTSELTLTQAKPGSSAKRQAKLPDGVDRMLSIIRDIFAAGHGEQQMPLLGGPPLACIGRDLLRRHLTSEGWFAEHLLCKAPDGSAKLTNGGHSKVHNSLTSLSRNGFLAFNRLWVWLL